MLRVMDAPGFYAAFPWGGYARKKGATGTRSNVIYSGNWLFEQQRSQTQTAQSTAAGAQLTRDDEPDAPRRPSRTKVIGRA